MASFIAYYRVSTQKQGQSGLGLEAQQAAVDAYVGQQDGALVQSFKDVESGKNDARPALAQALTACRAMKATLVIQAGPSGAQCRVPAAHRPRVGRWRCGLL
jgi:DNA invertase Pin-like site-specific DNA recombinase